MFYIYYIHFTIYYFSLYFSLFHAPRFTKGEDVDNWITVDPETGKVFTAKGLDRESPLLTTSPYSVILYVVHNGKKKQ